MLPMSWDTVALRVEGVFQRVISDHHAVQRSSLPGPTERAAA